MAYTQDIIDLVDRYFHLRTTNNPDSFKFELSALIEKVQMHSAINMWLSLNNMSKHKLIDDAFHESTNAECANLYIIINECDWNLNKFISRIDERQRGILFSYIVKNYEGISFENFEKNYIT